MKQETIGKKEHVISFAHKDVGVTYLQYSASALVTHVMTLKWVLTLTAIFSSFSNSNRHSLPSSRSMVVGAPS